MGQDPIILIIRTVGEMYAFIVILRFLLQMSHADYYNPISQAIARLTNVPVVAISRAIPRVGRFDLSALLYAIAIKLGILLALFLVAGLAIPNLLLLLMYATIGILDAILTIYFWAVLGSVIISWVAPGSYHPGPQLIQQITEPLFKLAQKIIPPIGGLDLSPILIFIVIQIIQAQLSRFII
ncbi:MAG: YggT family protein [Neptuniibacter caesariensis]|uniref:YggT family protein n=1 Tax=Neptuniibacter caesariensis TaxID=207954 RepID=A0A2G6JB93_NEPCE|nr:MAG: YggT family protein [Neptuniibacter caesariensis]